MSDNIFAMSLIATWAISALALSVSLALITVPFLLGEKYSLILVGMTVGPLSFFSLMGLRELGTRSRGRTEKARTGLGAAR